MAWGTMPGYQREHERQPQAVESFRPGLELGPTMCELKDLEQGMVPL